MLFSAARPRNTSGCRTFPGRAVAKCLTVQFTRTVKILQTQTPNCRISTSHSSSATNYVAKIMVFQGQSLRKCGGSCGGIQNVESLGKDFDKYECHLKCSGRLQT